MDDFEYAVESQTLPSFLKQDQDLGSTSNLSTTEGGGIMGENELDRLMREMSEADIDAFAAESVDAWMGAAGFVAVQTQDFWLIHQVTRGVKPIPADDTSDSVPARRNVQSDAAMRDSTLNGDNLDDLEAPIGSSV